MTLTGKDEEASSKVYGLVHLDTATTAAATKTAEKIEEAVDADVFPPNPLTQERLGFSKVDKIEEESNLLALYRGLLIHLSNPLCTETVQGWQEKTEIATGIYHAYKSQHGRS